MNPFRKRNPILKIRRGCHVWLGATKPNGYPEIWRNGKVRYAHRVAWEAKHGPIPPGLETDHLCNVRACVNVRHLELVSHRENMKRAAMRRRAA